MRKMSLVAATLAMATAATAMAAGVTSCSQTPVNVPVRTFEQAQKVAVICMAVNDANGAPLSFGALKPLPQSECAPVPPNVSGAGLPNHLYAMVTQETPGELAVVDLTAGNVIDEDRSTPGINFIPVGSDPTDVTATTDGAFTFVASADPNKPAIYTIDNRRLLGDSTGTGTPAPRPLRLTDLVACGLPQPPVALTVAAVAKPRPGELPFVLVAVLRAAAGQAAMVVALDPGPLVAATSPAGATDAGFGPGRLAACRAMGAWQLSSTLPGSFNVGPAWPQGVPYVDGGIAVPMPSLGPSCGPGPTGDGGGSPDAGGPDAQAGLEEGGAMDAGLAAEASADGSSGDGGAPDAGMDASVPDAEGGDAGSTDGSIPLAFGPLDPPRPSAIALRDDLHVLYVADDAMPLIHVIDLSDPASPRELAPLLATSVVNPTRRVTVGPIAISPPTSDYKRYLYAVDARAGSLMVYDVTDPTSSPRTPLVRPHAELTPLQDPDRILFPAPVAALAFAQHDWPLPQPGASTPVHQYTGLICNPNPNATPDAGTFESLGAYYRPDQAGTIQASGTPEGFPQRLRGIFAFVTLANGTMQVVDVDDWDAPCRRPDPMADGGLTSVALGMTGALDVPEPRAATGDLDPYHAPIVYNPAVGTAGVTEEAFFPVSAPNRVRSSYLLANDPTSGLHVPNLVGVPQLFDGNGAPVSTSGRTGLREPLLLPTMLPAGFYDPSYVVNPMLPDPTKRVASVAALVQTSSGTAAALTPGSMATSPPAVRISFDDPTAHVDQDWTVTYEGALPTVSGISADIVSSDGYETLTLQTPGAGLCSRGIEDRTLGQMRAAQVLAALGQAGLPTSGVATPAAPNPAPLDQWTGDYIEITDDIPAQGDPYWSQPANPGDALGDQVCWEGDLANDADPNVASERFNVCNSAFSVGANADTYLARDFPILEAHDDYLTVGRFGWDPSVTEQTTNRVIVGRDPSNAPFLKLAQCCFHRQAAFKVRTGGEWVAVGTNSVGLLHHVVVQAGDATRRCVLSCDPRMALLNARSFDIPWSNPAAPVACAPPPLGDLSAIARNSVLAMRNPVFSYVTWTGCGPPAGVGDHTLTARDFTWKFSMRGGFSPLTISLTQGMNAFVSPQSMLYVGALGQMAVVDGAQQGLVLIDLNTLAFAHPPYF